MWDDIDGRTELMFYQLTYLLCISGRPMVYALVVEVALKY